MIEKLQACEFIVLDKRNLIHTQKGLDFFQAVPDIATNPDMTALWAEKQEQIEHREILMLMNLSNNCMVTLIVYYRMILEKT